VRPSMLLRSPARSPTAAIATPASPINSAAPPLSQCQDLNHGQPELHQGISFGPLSHSLEGTSGRNLVWFLYQLLFMLRNIAGGYHASGRESRISTNYRAVPPNC
jgi:hypothetical protein